MRPQGQEEDPGAALRPYLAALALLAFAHVAPALLTGRTYLQGDAGFQVIPALHALHGTAPIVGAPSWHPWMLGGVPTEALPSMPRYPLNPAWLLPAHVALPVFLGLHLAIAAFGAFLFARRAAGVSNAGAALAAMVYAFGGALWMRGMHPENVAIAAWLPALLVAVRETAGAESSARRKRGAGAIALVTAAMLLVGGGAPLLLLAAMTCVWAFADARPKRPFEALAWCAGGASLGVLAGLPGFGPMIETVGLAARGQLSLAATGAFALEPGDLLRLWVPDVIGDVAWPYYVERWLYVGLLPLPLLVLGVRGRISIAIALAIALTLALGTSGLLHTLLYEALPPFRLFRAPGRWAIVAALFAGTLAGRGLDRLLHDHALAGAYRAERWQVWLGALPAIAGAAAIIAAIAGAKPAASYWIAGVAGFTSGAWFLAVDRARAHPAVPIAALAIVGFDLLAPAMRVRPLPIELLDAPPIYASAARAAGDARIAHSDEVTATDASWYPFAHGIRWGYRNARGYSQLVSSPYSRLLGDGEIHIFGGPKAPDAAALRLLGAGVWVGSSAPEGWTEIARDGELAAWQAEEPFVAAIVANVIVATDEDDARAKSLTVDPRATAVLLEAAESGAGTARVVRRTSDVIEVEIDAPNAGVLVLAEAWHPRWRAKVDGVGADILRADSIWQAVRVSAGARRVTFRCSPAVPLIAWLLSTAGFAIAVSLRRPRRPRSRTSPGDSASSGR